MVDVAVYLLPESEYRRKQLATYALIHREDTYDSPAFLLDIAALYNAGYQEDAWFFYIQFVSKAAPQTVNQAFDLYPNALSATDFFWD